MSTSIDAALAGLPGRPGADRHGLLRRRARGARVGLLPARHLPAEPGPVAPLGALLGLAVACCSASASTRGSVRLDLRRFFRWTGVFILMVAAGILAGSLRACTKPGCGITCRPAGLGPERRAAGRQLARHGADRPVRLFGPAGRRRGDRLVCCSSRSRSTCSSPIRAAASARCASSSGASRAAHERVAAAMPRRAMRLALAGAALLVVLGRRGLLLRRRATAEPPDRGRRGDGHHRRQGLRPERR